MTLTMYYLPGTESICGMVKLPMIISRKTVWSVIRLGVITVSILKIWHSLNMMRLQVLI